MALNYKQLLELELNLNKSDPEFSFVFVSNNLSIHGKVLNNMYLLPTIGQNGEIRVDFAIGENSQARIEKYGRIFDYEGAFLLIPFENNYDSIIFNLDDSDGGLEILLENNIIDNEIYEIIINSMKNRCPLQVNIKLNET